MKHALVTGSTRGIGLAIAAKLIETGYFVFTNGRGENRIAFENSKYVQADLSTLDGVNKLADSVLNETEALDALILNAGTTCRKPTRDIEHSDWQAVMNTNLNMPFFLVQRLFDSIAENGSVVFIGSAMSLKPHATSMPYGVSKAAINMLAQSLVKEFAPRNIRVNVICPGFIDTEWQKEKPARLRSNIESKIALKRFGSPEEVAEICRSIIDNGYINGSVVSVDGGYGME
jgi:NAD(P)-dependent dehydrogenase (short-subunit alcohol dehydrogenase family)